MLEKFRANVLKQPFLTISTDVQSLFEEYLCPPGRRFGIIKPLTLHKSPACLKEPRCVFVPRSWLKCAVNLAIEEQVSQAVDSRNASSSKTKYPSRTTDLRLICQTSACVRFGNYNCFLDSYYFLEISRPPSYAAKISGISHNNLSYIKRRDHCVRDL